MSQVYIFEDNPEDLAMLQALYSRSSKSVTQHYDKVRSLGSEKFLNNYLINYGHKSIADTAFTTIFIEDVSFLAAKVIQDNNLYNGQESSSRYLNYSNCKFYNPDDSIPEISEIYNNLITFYNSNLNRVSDHYFQITNDKKASKTITFDIMRAFLPIGCKTQLSWSGSLRNMYDNCLRLRTHVLPEVQEIGKQIYFNLLDQYPNSFNYKETTEQLTHLINSSKLFNFDNDLLNPISTIYNLSFSRFSWYEVTRYIDIINNRTEKNEIPKFFNKLGLIDIDFTLDYGSYRDFQRHRNGYNNLPLVNGKYDFNEDYIDFLPDDLKVDAVNLINKTLSTISNLNLNDFEKQYLFPLITNIKSTYSCTFPQLIYILELRTKETVHFSLRKLMLKILADVETKFPNLKLFCDKKPFNHISIKRGQQNIIEKK